MVYDDEPVNTRLHALRVATPACAGGARPSIQEHQVLAYLDQGRAVGREGGGERGSKRARLVGWHGAAIEGPGEGLKIGVALA